MTENHSLPISMDLAVAVLDNSPVAVFVSSVSSHKLLYANRLAKELFPGVNQPDAACYSVAGFDAPCPFCHTGEMNPTRLTVREYHHPRSGRTYQLSGKLIDWAGEPVHIEYILDITQAKREEERRCKIQEELEATFGGIPCGLCVYQAEGESILPLFHNSAFFEIMGYSDEHIRMVIRETDYLGVHPQDLDELRVKIKKAILNGGVMRHTYRLWNDRAGEYRWIHLEGAVRTGADGRKLLYCVYSDAGEQKRLENELIDANGKMRETQQELDHLVNSITGGIASYQIMDGRFVPIFYSEGVAALSGHTREEYEEMFGRDALDVVYEQDRERVCAQAMSAVESGAVLDVFYRICHKDGRLIWVHLNGRRLGTLPGAVRFYAVITGMSAETRLFQSIANETADAIYIINKENYDLLYANESKGLFAHGRPCVGHKCFSALHGKSKPCEFCTLNIYGPDGEEHAIAVDGTDRFFSSRIKETNWNGIPSYVQYIRDVTKEVGIRRDKDRLEMYFHTLVDNLPGGISVIRCEPDGRMKPEFFSEGFPVMLHMSQQEAQELFKDDLFAAIHPDDAAAVQKKLRQFMGSDQPRLELTLRMQRSDGGYIWVKTALSMLKAQDGVLRLYLMYTDITKTVEEKDQLRRQYEELILKHYRTPDPNTLILGHCNISKNRILEIWDSTNSGLLSAFGSVREEFFTGLSTLIVEQTERQAFLNVYLNRPSMEAFQRNDTERVMTCFVKLPREETGRYVKILMNLVTAPDTGDITGILTVTDVTEQTISDRILHQLSVTSHDYVIDLDLNRDVYTVLTLNQNARRVPQPTGRHSERVAYMAKAVVAPKDVRLYTQSLEPGEMRRRLDKEGAYTFTYSVTDEEGDIRTKNMTVSAIDMRLGRVCLVCTDITASVREQQGLLHMMAYTFELMCFLDVISGGLTMYTRQMVLENLPPYLIGNYSDSIPLFLDRYLPKEATGGMDSQFSLETIRKRLEREPSGYDFVFPYQAEEGLRYKQVNVLWGDRNHRTVCMVRADVTDILAAERSSKKALEEALAFAKEANRAKSDFLSAMSHDIRTPMNAIMGMTTLALAHLDDRERVESCLQKIAVSNKHLLSLINDVLDMSRIERSKIAMSRMEISLPEIVEQLAWIMEPQTQSAGLRFEVCTEGIAHPYFYGDSLRINQVLLNLLSNAVKFTPEGGQVRFAVQELPAQKGGDHVRYRFTISDTGIGMPEEFLFHIFEPFARSLNTARIEGTGLGLSITKGLVDLMEGEITVQSSESKGSTFRVELEFEKAAGKTVRRSKAALDGGAGAAKGKPLSGCVFLIAEDNAINAEILCELLSMYGAEAVVKTDGLQAVEEFRVTAPGTYDAILMDIQMPVMNGYEACRRIRALDRPDAGAIPVIAMTANAFAEDIHKALEAGMNAHVAKPIDLRILQETLSSVLAL